MRHYMSYSSFLMERMAPFSRRLTCCLLYTSMNEILLHEVDIAALESDIDQKVRQRVGQVLSLIHI